MLRSSRLALAAATLLAALTVARADPLDEARTRVTALAGDARIAPDTVEIAVRGDVLDKLVAGFGHQTVVANVRSTRVQGQIAPGRRTYLELRDDPAIVGQVTASQISGRWEGASHRLLVTAHAQASATAHLKAMVVGIGSRPDVHASTSADARLSLVIGNARFAWLAGSLGLESPGSLQVDLDTQLGRVPAKIDLPTSKPLAAFRLGDTLRFPVQLSRGRTLEIAIEPVSSAVRPDGIVTTGLAQVSVTP